MRLTLHVEASVQRCSLERHTAGVWLMNLENEQRMKTSSMPECGLPAHIFAEVIRRLPVLRICEDGYSPLFDLMTNHKELGCTERKVRMSKGNNSGRGAMSQQAASRIQGAGARNPGSSTAKSGFGPRAQSAGAHNASTQGQGSQASPAGSK
jgi:hypothetical protein